MGGQWQAAWFVPVQRLDERITVTNFGGIVTGTFEDVIDMFFLRQDDAPPPQQAGRFFSVHRCTGQQLDAVRSKAMRKR